MIDEAAVKRLRLQWFVTLQCVFALSAVFFIAIGAILQTCVYRHLAVTPFVPPLVLSALLYAECVQLLLLEPD